MFEKSNLLLAWWLEVSAYRQKPPSGLKILQFLLVHGGGLFYETLRKRLCRSEFNSPNTFQTPS